MNKLIKGDKSVWISVLFLVAYSSLLVYSSSSNLAYQYHGGSSLPIGLKHVAHILMGFALIVLVSNIPFRFFYNTSILVYIAAIVLIFIALTRGTTIGGASAERWVRIFGFSFQPSELAKVSIILLLSRQLVKHQDKLQSFKKSFLYILAPILLLFAFVFKSSLSSATFIFFISFVLLYIGNYSTKNLLKMAGSGILIMVLVISIFKFFPSVANRFDTWEARIERFIGEEQHDPDGNYQSDHAKMAIVRGHYTGVGPGKSVHKYFLPQSNSDFVYAIIGEEYGYGGMIFPIIVYLFLVFRFLTIANHALNDFGRLLVVGLGFSILLQAFINMGVAVGLLPVTGQTLPLISAGGSSIWMTCIAIGVILSVSHSSILAKKELEEELLERAKNTLEISRSMAMAEGRVFDEKAYLKEEVKRLKSEYKNQQEY